MDLQKELAEARQKISSLEQELVVAKTRLRELSEFPHLMKDWFGYFVRHLPVSVAMFDKNMNYLIASEKYIKDYKIQGVEIIGKNHYEVFPDVPQRWKDVHRRCMTGVVESCEKDEYYTRNGRTLFIDWIITPWYDENNQIGGLILFAEIVDE
ncbi:MAG: PAS domain-containing protein [Bacteroidia bacterium]|nr:PAS domain-containing protein [Bacteroidia bacterium]